MTNLLYTCLVVCFSWQILQTHLLDFFTCDTWKVSHLKHLNTWNS